MAKQILSLTVNDEAVEVLPAPVSYEEQLRQVKELAKSDPKMVASVVRDWVNKDE